MIVIIDATDGLMCQIITRLSSLAVLGLAVVSILSNKGKLTQVCIVKHFKIFTMTETDFTLYICYNRQVDLLARKLH